MREYRSIDAGGHAVAPPPPRETGLAQALERPE